MTDTEPYTERKERGLLTREGVGSFEKPKLALRVLLFLRRNGKTSVLNMLSEGWNRKTTEASLRKLEELDLVGIEKRESFPRFEKAYYLTDRGGYVADFVRHLKKELSSTFGMELEEFSRLPKGCMPILVSMHRRGYEGISRMLKRLNLSPHQAYRCLDSMKSNGILIREKCQRGKRMVSFYSLSERGLSLAVAVDALDRALEGSTNLSH